VRLPHDSCAQSQDKNGVRRVCRYSSYVSSTAGAFTIWGGAVADPREYPAQFYYKSQSDDICTASLISSQVMITAGHCVYTGFKFSTRPNNWTNVDTVATCTKLDAPPDTPRLDIALCWFDKPLPGPFQPVNIDAGLVKPEANTAITIVGFGCSGNKEPDPNHPPLRYGSTNALKIEGGAVLVSGQAQICLGDSGGPAFVVRPGGKRVQIAVNSFSSGDTGSWLALTGSAKATAEIKQWVAKTDPAQHLCGIDPNATHCQY
jgi:hypothetical protein